MGGFSVLTVSQLSTYLKSVLDSEDKLKGIYIKGEIADLRDNFGSGHIYFTLKEGGASVKAVLFQSYREHIRFSLRDGMAVIIRGDISYYSRDGACQLYVFDAQPDGIGAKYIALEQLKEKLEKEGLFSIAHKRPLPQYPKCIGVVTSATGAAIQDILKVLNRRWPVAKVIVSHASVQGDKSSFEVAKAIDEQNRLGKADVLIVGRGGGSNEDLFSFNDETLVRSVYNSAIPIVSAVGHETDYTLCDLVADMRAPTPSAAAEMVSPDINNLKSYIDNTRNFLYSCLINKLEESQKLLDMNKEELKRSMDMAILEKSDELTRIMEKLNSRSPLMLLSKGYCYAAKNDKAILSIKNVSINDEILIRLSDGTIKAKVMDIKESELVG